MSHKFNRCLENRGLRRFAVNRQAIEGELREARRDLDSAGKSLREQDYKWTIIKAYYSMFHAGKALLFSAGYREGSHDCLITGIEELFIDRGLLAGSLVTGLRNAKAAREAADYGLTYGKNAAEGTVKDADHIWEIVSRYLAGKGFAIP